MPQIKHQVWKSIGEYEDTEAFREFLHREFPREASVWEESLSRRNFIQIMGASLALAGLSSACSRMPMEKIIPYVNQPESLIPGKPQYFASTFSMGGISQGVIVESHEGRPTKIEGNPDHPANHGSSDPFMQASVLSLYDPDRLKTVQYKNEISTWDRFLESTRTSSWTTRAGKGLAILTEKISSPTLRSEIARFLTTYPHATWYEFDPLQSGTTAQATQLVFGEKLSPIYDFEKAEVVLSLDGPFLDEGAGRLAYARQFTQSRRLRRGQSKMNRLYVVESTPSLTGTMADHRWSRNPSEMEDIARALAYELGMEDVSPSPSASQINPWIKAVAQDLQEHAGKCLVVTSARQTSSIQAICLAINSRLGNIHQTLSFLPVISSPSLPIKILLENIQAGQVDSIFILGGNPVYNLPADLDFKTALSKVPVKIRLSQYGDETAACCDWQLAEAHFLESWGDAVAFEGTASIQQPICAPLYDGKSAIEFFTLLSNSPGENGHQRVQQFWKDQNWETILRNGVIPKAPVSEQSVKIRSFQLPQKPHELEGLEIVIQEDRSVYDGRFSNNGWLQELPDPVTKLTWGNAILVSAETARSLSLNEQDEVELSLQGKSVTGGVLILPGQAENTVTVHLGYGRTHAGQVGNTHGFNAFLLQSSDSPFYGHGVKIKKTGQQQLLATTQHHFSIEGRDLVRKGTLSQFIENPEKISPPKKNEEGIVPEMDYPGAAWAMSIDLGTCIGCNACMIACQAENNIPIVGKSEVMRGRSMHWIRVDRYYEGQPENARASFQPVPCMHCEKAPCEEVCPTAATSHSGEGLNQMTYNRCVGTRFCSNNCPYKVRRFNFFQYSDMKSSLAKVSKNPDVTVRSRGVMEKCSYCVQRIQEAKLTTELEDRAILDGDIVTACQGACPTQAIVFGDQNDPNSRVARLKREPLNYSLLDDLGTKPRTTYLAKISHPNPAIGPERT